MVKINQNNKYVIANPTNQDIKITKNDRNESIWNSLSTFNKNGDDTLDANEIAAFNKAVTDAAGSDKKLTQNELSAFANRIGVSINDLKKAIVLINADVIAAGIEKDLKTESLKDDAKNLIGKINENNVSEVWDQYQSISDKNTKNGKKSSLSNDIIKNFEFEEAKPMLNKIFSSFQELAKKSNVNIDSLVEQYNNAAKSNHAFVMDTVLREIGARLNMSTRQSNMIDTRIQINKDKNLSVKKTEQSQIEMEKAAIKHEIPISDDLFGNGVLGDTESVALTRQSRMVLRATKMIMEDPKMKEMLQACVKREKDCIAVYSQPKNQVYVRTENSLITAGVSENVVGDGDMAVFVSAVLKMASLESIVFKDTNDAKQYIIRSFKPDLYGADK